MNAAPVTAADQEPDNRPPTVIEQTLAEHVCGAMPSSSTGDVHEPCVHAQHRALRAEFGYDLGRLSAAERGELDARCSRLRTPENYDPYLNCLTAWLVAVRESRRPEDRAAAGGAEVFGVVSANPAARPPEPPRHTSTFVWVTIGILVGAGAAAGGVRLKKQLAQVTPACQRCGAVLKGSGSLCPPCRHEMGVAAKQAIADRAAEKQAEDVRRRSEQHQAEERQRLAEAQAAQEQQRLEETTSRLAREAHEPAQAAPRPFEPAPVGADPYESIEAVETNQIGRAHV